MMPPPPKSGKHCGHDPENPRLSPLETIRKGPGGPPRILSLGAERAKEWYHRPEQCPPLQTRFGRRTRSERREAIQVVLEFFLSRLDLASLCLGTPTLKAGFIDLDMKTIVQETGLGQRRCERAIGQLKAAGFMEVKQPRRRNAEGKYYGLRAVRVLTVRLFEWLGLGAMLARERSRASKALKAKIAKFGLGLGDVFRRIFKGRNKPAGTPVRAGPEFSFASLDLRRLWNSRYGEAVRAGIDCEEAQRQVNAALGFPPAWSPGRPLPAGVRK